MFTGYSQTHRPCPSEVALPGGIVVMLHEQSISEVYDYAKLEQDAEDELLRTIVVYATLVVIGKQLSKCLPSLACWNFA